MPTLETCGLAEVLVLEEVMERDEDMPGSRGLASAASAVFKFDTSPITLTMSFSEGGDAGK